MSVHLIHMYVMTIIFFLDLTAGDGVPTFDDWEIV